MKAKRSSHFNRVGYVTATIRDDRLTSIRDVAQTSQLRKERTLGDGISDGFWVDAVSRRESKPDPIWPVPGPTGRGESGLGQ
jgi:hypothetical protein